jgi:hypothetical protein
VRVKSKKKRDRARINITLSVRENLQEAIGCSALLLVPRAKVSRSLKHWQSVCGIEYLTHHRVITYSTRRKKSLDTD